MGTKGKRFLKFLLRLIIFIILLISIVIFLSQITYSDKTKYIKPISLNLLNNYNEILKDKDNKLLSEKEIVELLKNSGCKDVNNVKSDIVKTEISNRKNYSNNWFYANCISKQDINIKVSFTAHETGFPDFRIDYKHSYCFDLMHKRVECYTQHIISIPSR